MGNMIIEGSMKTFSNIWIMNGCEGNIKYFSPGWGNISRSRRLREIFSHPRGKYLMFPKHPFITYSFCYTTTPYDQLQPHPQSGFYIKLPLAMYYTNCGCGHCSLHSQTWNLWKLRGASTHVWGQYETDMREGEGRGGGILTTGCEF